MIRFPNPGTNVDEFIRTFKVLYEHLKDFHTFSLDDMKSAMATMYLAASVGNIGEKALQLSDKKDRSRDQLYNNAKMYAELYRTLGWISSTPEKALEFSFTHLGEYVATAELDSRIIFEECLFGINYPNEVLSVKGEEVTRPYASIILFASKMGGYITRDEMIIGPMCTSDNNAVVLNEKIEWVLQCRRTLSTQKQLELLADRLSNNGGSKSGIQVNTLHNYTRFPIATLTGFGYFEKVSSKKIPFKIGEKVILKLTKKGVEKAKMLSESTDVRLDTVKQYSGEKLHALIRIGFYSMLGRSHFDLTPVLNTLENDSHLLNIETTKVQFSPYQTLPANIVDDALGLKKIESTKQKTVYDVQSITTSSYRRSCIELVNNEDDVLYSPQQNTIRDFITDSIDQGMLQGAIVEQIFTYLADKTKEEFYSAIAELFTIAGLPCRASRNGINYERWDALIEDDQFTIPIEIKSPREEKCISIKAIRQAAENKIVMLSRKSYSTDKETVTLSVGFYPPNERAEVESLIDNIHQTFGINIGVLDTKTLIAIAVNAICNNEIINRDSFRLSRGVLFE